MPSVSNIPVLEPKQTRVRRATRQRRIRRRLRTPIGAVGIALGSTMLVQHSYNTRTTRRAPTSAYHCRRKLGFIAHHRHRLLRRQPEAQPPAQPSGLLDAPSGLSGLTVVAEVGGHCCVGGWRASGRGCPEETPSASRTVEPVVVSVRWVPVPAGGDRVGWCAGMCGSDCPPVTSRNCLPSVVSSWIT